jgi:outer membrane protein TolC
MRLEQVEYLPRISLFGNYGISSQQNGDPAFFGAPRAYSRAVGVQLTVPIFQGFQRDARIDQKRAALRQAETQTGLARSQATAEVRTLLEQADEARARADGQRLAVVQAGRGFDIARAQYREGLGSQLELTDAEVALRQSEFNYAQAVYDFLVARARLDAAAGRVPLVEERVGGGDDA